MRIQNNITAMNTHRQYTINNDNVAKAAEKLSSGYRINRAADDAAGLAISEKMRSQIRGLNMATKNSQDAISLVQTAEGALQETQNMLQRMNELAVQAATGTNENFDRTQAAKEFEQLKREINDVAESTTFNNMKILDGSLSYEGYVRSAQTAGVTNTATEIPKEAAIGSIDTVAYKAANVGKAQKITFSLSTTDAAKKILSDNTTSYTDGPLKATGIDLTAAAVTGATTPANLTVKFDFDNSGNTYAANGSTDVTFTKVITDGHADKITVTASDGAGREYEGSVAADGTITLTEKLGTGKTAFDGPDAALANYSYNSGTIAPTGGEKGTPATPETTTAVIDESKLKIGDTFSIGNAKFEIVKNGGTAATGVNAIQADADGKVQLSTISTALANAKLTDGTTALSTELDVALNQASKTLTVKQKAGQEAPVGSTTPVYKSTKVVFGDPNQKTTSEYKNTIEFDTAKMKDGDTFVFNIGGKTATVKFDAGKYQTTKGESAAEKFAKDVATKLKDAGADVTAKGNALLYTGKKVLDENIKLDPSATAGVQGAKDYPTNAMRIQVGALEDEQLAISIDAMNTAGLKLDGFTLDSQNEAGMAITAVRSAVNKVSDQRATLGAMQNRLDHKIANLKVSSENLSAAESRIRDVDMASEMTNFTKNNILSQAATAMLAQANALPQNVLSLLG